MPKINEQDRISMVKHLKDLSGKAIIASTKHSKNIQKQIDHSIELTKFIKEDRSKIERLNNVIDMKQRKIDTLNKENTDLLWNLSKLQYDMGKMQKDKEIRETRKAQFEKINTHFYKDESVDN